MEEAILKLLYYLIRALVLGTYYSVAFLVRGILKLVRKVRAPVVMAATRPMPKALVSSGEPTTTVPIVSALGSVKYERALAKIVERAEAEATRCAIEEQNERLVDTLSRCIAGRARTAMGRLRRKDTPAAILDAERVVGELSFLLEVTSDLANQRRDPEKLLLLGDADALAEACYRPLFEHARGAGIRLLTSRAVTFLGDKDLGIFTGFIPTGLAPIILPTAWATEIGWWPALAHEIGHDFHASVVGFDTELRRRTGFADGRGLPGPKRGLTQADVTAAHAAWLPEIFADLFGTMMLGSAYVTTMMWKFADPKSPARVVTVQPVAADEWTEYDEHPPAHLRVVLSCRLLATIGFPVEARALEDEWRQRHESPEVLLVPTRGKTFYTVTERPYLECGEALIAGIYQWGFSSLAGFSLRSIPGLDLGPREHQAALEAKDVFLAGQPSATPDPRCLIAGAVLAWKERPALSARVLRAARATIASVGVSRAQLRLRAAREEEGTLDPTTADAQAWREAFLLGEALAPPAGSRLMRRL